MKKACVLLITGALIAGMFGCPADSDPQPTPPVRYELTVSSTEGGEATAPGEGTFAYDEGTAVSLIAEAEEGYRFVEWTGDTRRIADVNAAATTIAMDGNYSITARFQEALPRTGAWVDEVVITRETEPDAALLQLSEGTLDIYAHALGDALLYEQVAADPYVRSVCSVGDFVEFTFNPSGPVFPVTGKLNPFAVPEIREAVNWLIDRDHIIANWMGGLGIPRYTCLMSAGADARERYPNLIAAIEAHYAPDPARAESVITKEMEKLGAVFEEGCWWYDGEQVEIIFLVRVDDDRKGIGDYLAGLLADMGFRVTVSYGTGSSHQAIWLHADPALGRWHIYTGGWRRGVISRDEGWSFAHFYTPLGRSETLWESYKNAPVFYGAAEKLWNHDYGTIEERSELFETCLWGSMQDSVRVFIADRTMFTPLRADVRVAHDLSDGVRGSWAWALTAHFVADGEPVAGGTLRVATRDLDAYTWNPIAGSESLEDMFAIRATADLGLQPDTRTGLRWPGRIEKAEVYVQTGLPVGVTNADWCSVIFVPEIEVPLDAWVDWDAMTQKFVSVNDKMDSGSPYYDENLDRSALLQSVSYYPKDIFYIPLHDGSTLSMGDFILYTILMFDRAKPESAIYDESSVAQYRNFMGGFRGVRFITDDPEYGLIVEYYSDVWQIDAERAVTTMFPVYAQGPGVWHTIALGIRAEANKQLAFSGSRSAGLGVEWMSFIAGPSLGILGQQLTLARASNYIPYAPTMGIYVTAEEATARWSNLVDWVNTRHHFWVASGPFYLDTVYPTGKSLLLKRFEDYPDPADRWLFLLDPLD